MQKGKAADHMITQDTSSDRHGIFTGSDPFVLCREWFNQAQKTEINDPDAVALATVDSEGMPNVRIVLLREIEVLGGGAGAFVFYTNYGSKKAQEMLLSGKASFVFHWKSLRRQIRVRGTVSKEDGALADTYFAQRSVQSRLGAWASRQSSPLENRGTLSSEVEKMARRHKDSPPRPPFWGGFRVIPQEIEFWAEGDFRLHDRFLWMQSSDHQKWIVTRLNP